VTDLEQYIYNCYLEVSRKSNNKPFRYRKDFEGFDESENFIYVTKLGNFFNKFPHIKVKDFFQAPYSVYNEKYFELKYFTTQKALKAYTIYQSKFLVEDPDKPETIQKVKDSFEFIYNFCKDKKIDFNGYIDYIELDKKWHEFLLHLKYREIIIYPLFSFPTFDKVINQYDRQIKEFAFGDTLNNINLYRTKYHASSKAKKISTLIYQTLNSKLQNL